MAEDVLVRLKLAGEQLGEQVRGSFAGLKTEAQSAGAEAGRALSQGVKAGADKVTSATTMAARGVTEYEVALLRNTQAIDRFAVEHAQANTTINQAKAAFKAGEITQAEYTATTLKARQAISLLQSELRQTSAELNASAAAAKRAQQDMRGVTAVTGAQRAGFNQLSMQLGDVATQYALGARPMQIFAAQSAQVVQAIGLARGSAGGLIGFLGGPWGIGLTAAVIALTPFIEGLLSSEKALDEVRFASGAMGDAQSILGGVMDLTTGKINTQSEALKALARAQALAGQVQAEARAAEARASVTALQDKDWKFGGGMGGGFFIGRERPIEGQISSQYLNEVITGEQAINKLKQLKDAGRITTEVFLEATQAIANLGVETENIKVFDKLNEALNGDPAAINEFLKPTKARKGSNRISDAERAAKAAARAEQEFTESVQKSLEAQNDSARVEQVRAEKGEAAAAAEQARLSFLQQHPLAVHQTVEELARALGITRQLTVEDKTRLANLISAADAAEQAAARSASDAVRNQAQAGYESRVQAIDREIALLGIVGPARERAALALEEEAFKADLAAKGVENVDEKWEEYSRKRLQAISGQEMIEAEREAARIREENLRELSGLYEELFTGGTGRIWDDFKRQGARILAEVAAQYSLALISGQSAGSVGDVMASAGSRSPLGAIFGRTAANDNQVLSGAGLPDFGIGGRMKLPTGEIDESGAIGAGSGDILVTGNRPASLLDNAGIAIAAATVANSIGIGGGGKTAGLIGMAGSIGGQALGSTLGFLGAAGGPIGAIAGAVVGNLIGGLFKKTKYGTASISSADSLSTQGKGSGRAEDAGTLGGAVQDQLRQISEALGVDLGGFRVSIGTYKDSFRVSTTGRTGKLKGGNSDVHDFATEQAAIEYAVRDAIKDGALQGLSAASQAVLNKASDLNEALDKVLLIESVPKLLRERLDPLGAALDKVDAKFRDLAEALQEGGASAEQVAEARKLWELERVDAIKQIGEASAGLKEFLQSLKVGSDSPLSLRQQKAEADKALDPYVLAIEQAKSAQAEVERLKAGGAGADAIKAAEDAARTAAAGIDQEGFQQAAQLVLGLSRQINASSGGFFADFDRISALTGAGIAAIDAATPQAGAAQDPFTQATAANTQTIADQLTETNKLLKALNDNNVTTPNNKLGWISENRGYY